MTTNQTIFTLIPLLSAAVFLPTLLRPSASLYGRVLGLVSLASLAATAYAMRVFGVVLRGRSPKGKMPTDMSPGRLLLPANAAVCGILVLVYALSDPVSLGVSPALYLLPAGEIPSLFSRKLAYMYQPCSRLSWLLRKLWLALTLPFSKACATSTKALD